LQLEKKKFSQSGVLSENKIGFNNVSVDQTLLMASVFAKLLKSSDTLLLFGDIGSGKTFFARGVIQEMMRSQRRLLEEVPSPTFTIVQTYDVLSPPVWHLDLYRLSDAKEIIELDLEDAFETGICLIEWPNKMGSFIPKRNISIIFDQVDTAYDRRNIFIELNGTGWDRVYNGLLKSLSA
jgi:tRNA threonylcarbamoyladenosine biosynthesis protein TsaE